MSVERVQEGGRWDAPRLDESSPASAAAWGAAERFAETAAGKTVSVQYNSDMGPTPPAPLVLGTVTRASAQTTKDMTEGVLTLHVATPDGAGVLACRIVAPATELTAGYDQTTGNHLRDEGIASFGGCRVVVVDGRLHTTKTGASGYMHRTMSVAVA